MALIKTETFINENGIEMVREYFGKDANHISATVEKPIIVETEILEDPISEQDEINAEILLNQATILAKQEEQDEVLAEILLNQMEV